MQMLPMREAPAAAGGSIKEADHVLGQIGFEFFRTAAGGN